MTKDTTYCSGLWLLPQNPKNDELHYMRFLPETLKLIAGGRLVFYTPHPEVAQQVDALCRDFDIALKLRELRVEDLRAFGIAEDYCRACQATNLDHLPRPSSFRGEKTLVHYWRDFKDGGWDVYRRMIAIWLSRIHLVSHHVIPFDPFETTYFTWIDATISRVSETRENWDFTKVEPAAGQVSHYGARLKFFGRRLPVSGGVLESDRAGWSALHALYETYLEGSKHSAYAHDDETLLSFCHAERPELFRKIGDPIPRNRDARGRRMAGA